MAPETKSCTHSWRIEKAREVKAGQAEVGLGLGPKGGEAAEDSYRECLRRDGSSRQGGEKCEPGQ